MSIEHEPQDKSEHISLPTGEPLIPMGDREKDLWDRAGHDLTKFYHDLTALTAVEFVLKSRLMSSTKAYVGESQLALYKLENIVRLSLVQGVNPLIINERLITGLKLGYKLADGVEKIADKSSNPPIDRTIIIPVGSGYPVNVPEGLSWNFPVNPSSGNYD